MAVSNALKELLNGQTVASSRLSDKLVAELMSEGLLVPVIRGSRKSYHALDKEALKQYLVDKDESYRILDEVSADDISRSSMAASTGNSKLVYVRSCPGFPVNSYEPISCRMNNEELVVNPSTGSFLFITDWTRFAVPEDVVIVGIENMENFRLIRNQKEFFEREIGKRRILFVSRYPQSSDLRSWLQSVSNEYIHFGDFDLAGINIFITEFAKHLKQESSFLIPSDIEERIKDGSSQRYDAQYERFHGISTSDEKLQSLIDVINKYHRCYDQEGYIDKHYN